MAGATPLSLGALADDLLAYIATAHPNDSERATTAIQLVPLDGHCAAVEQLGKSDRCPIA